MKNQQTDWQRFLTDYAVAKEEYLAARDVAVRHSVNVDEMTAALLAEEQARDKLILSRRRVCASIEATVRA